MMLRNGASGRDDEGAPKSRLEPGRNFSGKLLQPTQIPEAPELLGTLRGVRSYPGRKAASGSGWKLAGSLPPSGKTCVCCVGLQETVWVDSSGRRCSWGASPPAPQAPRLPRKVGFAGGSDDRALVCEGDAAFRAETQRTCPASVLPGAGRGGDGDPESRLEPDRIESIRSDQPTQIPESPSVFSGHSIRLN